MSSESSESQNAFVAVDEATAQRQRTVIQMIDHINALPTFVQTKQLMLELLDPRPSEVALDAGCGAGDDTRVMATRVGATGQAIGIDLSAFLITAAGERAASDANATDFRVGDLCDLDFDDETFDLVRCERTLEYIPQSDLALDELLRVLRPDGRIVLCETDWGTRINGAGDPERNEALLREARERVPDPLGARMLPKRFRDRGLTQIEVHPMLFHQDSVALRKWMDFTNPDGQWYGDQSSGIFDAKNRSADEQAVLRVEAERAFATNTGFDVAIMFVVFGVKPSG